MFDLPAASSYAGIGARRTPSAVLAQMRRVAVRLARDGHTLRSGGADGADSAFEHHTRAVGGSPEVYLPWSGYNARRTDVAMTEPSLAALALAERHHPAWDRCSRGARSLHARNGHILLGPDLNDPVALVICWTPLAQRGGGTGQALRIASEWSIPILDLADPNELKQIRHWLRT